MDTRPVDWQGTTVQAAVPKRLAGWMPKLSAATIRATEQSAAAVTRFGDHAHGAAEASARLLLRAEGLASSAIEGLRASAADVALAEALSSDLPDGNVAAGVADNLAVVNQALTTPPPLTADTLLRWHRRLMRHDNFLHPRHVGAWRDELGWIGGATPRMAVHIASHQDDIPALIDDLVAFIARGDLDPITVAAIAHAQFETIHPFADGNGRIGRVIIGWLLKQRLDVDYPPPVSRQIARDVGGYQAGLTLYRQDHVDTWVSWFAEAVQLAAVHSTQELQRIADLQQTWEHALANVRRDAAARKLLTQLPAHPVVSALTVAELLEVTRPAAVNAINTLQNREILTPLDAVATGRNPRERWWAALDLLP